MLKKPLLPILATALLFTSVCHAADRLLPTEDAQKLGVSFKKDGKALYVDVLNASQSVLTGLTVQCEVDLPPVTMTPDYVPPARPRPKHLATGSAVVAPDEDFSLLFGNTSGDGRKGKGGEHISDYSSRTVRDREFVKLELTGLRVLPGKSVEGYTETPKAIRHCSALDPRGREKKLYEVF
ncbi:MULTISPECIES: hypothetical protein [unclassified Variovorax]|uniref:hypothetical protein n=1 Tax=unclassified Variovorax TaxID=663243 RepID=UPI0013192AF2|nr:MULTISPECIES: hypothetical protein [unclassified Variovorax]VTU42488.1 hypothetical protein SRS16P1_00282 [Variovorax sp. SRS16]VTU42511.1 hypothetical protein E5P1_00280 [Variovorax sp. PBL-E5]VTU44009.1 hypothetical protein H6P1_00649 [Variovorax sp. PBL-H6]